MGGKQPREIDLFARHLILIDCKHMFIYVRFDAVVVLLFICRNCVMEFIRCVFVQILITNSMSKSITTPYTTRIYFYNTIRSTASFPPESGALSIVEAPSNVLLLLLFNAHEWDWLAQKSINVSIIDQCPPRSRIHSLKDNWRSKAKHYSPPLLP